MYDSCCKYEEPLRRIVLHFNYPKISIFKVGSNNYSFSPPTNNDRISGCGIEFSRDYYGGVMSILTRMEKVW